MAIAFMKRPPLTSPTEVGVVLCGISPPFGRLSPTKRQITYVLLTRAPLYYGAEAPILARLACVRRAANVRSEPGSNSPVNLSSSRGSSLAGPSRLYRSFALHLWICRDPPVLLVSQQFSFQRTSAARATPSRQRGSLCSSPSQVGQATSKKSKERFRSPRPLARCLFWRTGGALYGSGPPVSTDLLACGSFSFLLAVPCA